MTMIFFVAGSVLPKLATPSEFTSLAKPMPDLYSDVTMATTEAPPTIAPLISAQEAISSTLSSLSSSITLTSVSELKSRYAGSENPSEESRLPGLFDVDPEGRNSGFELPLHPLRSLELQQQPGQQIPGSQEGLLLKSEPLMEGEREAREEPSAAAGAATKGLSDSSLESDEDTNLTEEQREQKSLDNIFRTLQLENPHAPAKDTPEFGYAEFERLLTDPEGQQRILTSTEKSQFESDRSEFVAPPTNQHPQVNGAGSEIVNAAGNQTGYLSEFLRQKTPSEGAEGADEKKLQGSSERGSPWPDIGGLELPTATAKGISPEGEPHTVSDIFPGASEETLQPLIAIGQSSAREQNLRDLSTGEAITGQIFREPRLELLELEVEESGSDGGKTAEEGATALSEASQPEAAMSAAQETMPPLITSQELPTVELNNLAETGSTDSGGQAEVPAPTALEVMGGRGRVVEGATGMAEQEIKQPGK